MFIKQILMHSLLPTSALPQHLSTCVHLFHYDSKYTSRLHPFSCNESSFPAEYDGLLGIKCISAFAYVISTYVQYYGKSQLCLWEFLIIPCQKKCRSWQFTSGFKSEKELFTAPELLLLSIFFTGHAQFGQPWPWSSPEQKQCKEMCKPAP